ncbi:hypothetical protein PSHT_14759, partial [Puccinia striiformis]
IITSSGCHRWITQQRRARRVFRMSAINDRLALRIAAIFVILVTSILGTLFPVLTRQSQRVSVPPWVYEAVKYFGSGVILATALIHLQAPASESLSSPCLSAGWSLYPFSQGITLASIFAIFIIEIIAIRVGTSRLAALGLKYCAHGINADQSPAEDAKTPSASGALDTTQPSALRLESNLDKFSEETATTRAGVPSAEVCSQLIGAAILELGVIFHSIVIGLTLAVNEQFTTFFLVIIFHRKPAHATTKRLMYPIHLLLFCPFRNVRGLGLGARLSQLSLPHRFRRLPLWGSLVVLLCHPTRLGIRLGPTKHALLSYWPTTLFQQNLALRTQQYQINFRYWLCGGRCRASQNYRALFHIFTKLMALLGRWA